MTSPHQLVQNVCFPLPNARLRPQWRKSNFRNPVKLQEEGAIERIGGPRLAGFHPVVPDNGYVNFLAAVNKRCNYYDAGTASKHIVRSSIKLINRILPTPMAPFQWTAELYERWSSRFGPEKKKRMEASLQTIFNGTLKEYNGKDLFVKVEALLVEHKPNWAPRVIYKGSDLYNVISGPMYWELMHRLDGCAESETGPHRVKFAYGRTPEQYVPFIQTGSGDFIESDFSANDKKQCQDVLRLEMMLVRRLGAPEWFLRLEHMGNKYQIRSWKHGFSAEAENSLATGKNDTTFRNCWWNWCIFNAFILREKSPSSRATIMGDDILARVSGLKRMAAKRYAKIAADARMDAKVSRHSHLVDCSFLSKVFIPVGGVNHTVIPLPGKALARFNTRANRNDAVTDNAYFAAKAVGYAYEFRFVPLLRDVFLDRFNFHWPLVNEEKHKARFLEDAFSYNAASAGLTLKNIKDKIIVTGDFVACREDLVEWCWYRYRCTVDEFIECFEDIVLCTDATDLSTPLLDSLVADFA